jgi:methionyl-tRNA formyltransferase
LLQTSHQLVGAYTQPDRPAGRGKTLRASAVKKLAEAAEIPVFQPASLKDAAQQQLLAEFRPDVIVVVAYGLILPQAVLDIPKMGCLNVHASLLPRWRGAAPIQRAIESGDAESGITIMQMDAGLDTGNMLASARCPIGSCTTAASLHDELAILGAPLLIEVLENLPSHQATAIAQDDNLATYASKILKAEAELDWALDATVLERMIRAFNPFPACFTTVGQDRLKIWEAEITTNSDSQAAGTITQVDRHGIRVSCGSGELCITRLQLPGGKILSVEQILNARSALFAPGSRLGDA